LKALLPAIVNSLAVVIGSLIGFFLRKGISERFRTILFYAVGLSTIGIGIQMIVGVNDFLIVLFSMVIGGVIGEWFDIERRLKKIRRYDARG